MSILSNLALLWKYKAQLKTVVGHAQTIQGAIKSTPKSGYLSSEFLTTVLTAGVMIYNTFRPEHGIDPTISAALAAAVVAIYTAGRTGLKAAHELIGVAKEIKVAVTDEPKKEEPKPELPKPVEPTL